MTRRLGLPAVTGQIVAGIRAWYQPEELTGKTIVIAANLAPAMLRGVESNGMLLAVSDENRENVVVLTTDKPVPSGWRVS